jgi:hypothetical protein
MRNTVVEFEKLHEQGSLMDPTGKVYLADPSMVESAIRAILDPLYGTDYDTELLTKAIEDVVKAYRGGYPGLLHCDTLYHDLRHALEAGLTTARIIDGNNKSLSSGNRQEYIDGDQALLTVLLALFHDIGMQRRDSEVNLWGPVLIPVHEERGVEFLLRYLSRTTLARFAEKAILIMPTKLVYEMPDTWSAFDKKIASIVASADLLSQLADRCYLEKCRDFLFVEFSAFGLAGKLDSRYPDRETLLSKTPAFFDEIIHKRLDGEFQGVDHYLEAHTGGTNPWLESMERNLAFLERILSSRNFAQLRRKAINYI